MIAKNDKDWHYQVCLRDNWTCQECGTYYGWSWCFNDNGVNQYVCGHHTKTKGSCPELRLDTDIGICIDKSCHLIKYP